MAGLQTNCQCLTSVFNASIEELQFQNFHKKKNCKLEDFS